MMTAIYFIAVIVYAFRNVNDEYWSVYHYFFVTWHTVMILIYAHKKIKTDLETALITGSVITKVLCLISFVIWFLIGADWTKTPFFFCMIVVVSMGISIRFRKYRYGKI